MEKKLRQAALDYNRLPVPGKISVEPTKGMTNQLGLSLAYAPGVAFACSAIHAEPVQAAKLTARSNLVGVVTNGIAILGLGNIGPLAAKPVMEGKALREFAGDCRQNYVGSKQSERRDYARGHIDKPTFADQRWPRKWCIPALEPAQCQREPAI